MEKTLQQLGEELQQEMLSPFVYILASVFFHQAIV